MNIAKLGIGLTALGWTFAVLADSPTIYRCDSDGAVVYSDRPCAADAAVYENGGSRVTVYEAPAVSERPSSRTSKPTTRKAKSNRNAGARLEQRQVLCAKLDQSLRDVRTRMRTGYGVKEGERLKARQRQLMERRRNEKCG